jgi:hypothetical protein
MAAATAGLAGLAELLSEGLARAFARQLDEPEIGDARDPEARGIPLRRLLQRAEHTALVLRVLHVDEVDDDDAAEIAHAQLPRDCGGSLQIGPVHRVLEVPRADEATGVHVDGRHGLRLLDDQMPPALEGHASRQGAADLRVDATALEERRLLLVEVEPAPELRQEAVHVAHHGRVGRRAIDADRGDVRAHEIAQHAHLHRQFLVDEGRRAAAVTASLDPLPGPGQERDVLREFRLLRSVGDGAHDVSEGVGHARPVPEHLHESAQAFPLGLVLDALGHAYVPREGHEHEETRRQGDVGRQPCALAGDRVLGDLHEHPPPLREQPLDGRRSDPLAARLLHGGPVAAPDVTRMEETGALQTDVDEGGLHAGQDAHDAARIDVAGDRGSPGPGKMQLLETAMLEQRDPGLERFDVDEHVVGHALEVLLLSASASEMAGSDRCRQVSTPAARSNASVSATGRPMTPE